MTIKLIAELEPKGGAFPLLDDTHLRGGARSVANTTARDAIPVAHRKIGMVVITQDTGRLWTLNGDLTNWTEFSGGAALAGDVIGDPGTNVVSAIRGMTTPDGATATDGQVLTAVQQTTFYTPYGCVYDNPYLWVGDNLAPQLVKFDPVNLTRTVYSLSFPLTGLAVDATYVAASTGVQVFAEGSTHTQVLFNKSGAMVGSASIDKWGTSVALDSVGNLWTTTRNTLVRIPIGAMLLAHPLPYIPINADKKTVTGASVVAGDGTYIFVGGSNAVRTIDPATKNTLATYTVAEADGTVVGLLCAAGALWVSTSAGKVIRLDPSSNLAEVAIITGFTPAPTNGLSWMAHAPYGDTPQIWVASGGSAHVYSIVIATNGLLSTTTTTNNTDTYGQLAFDTVNERLWCPATSTPKSTLVSFIEDGTEETRYVGPYALTYVSPSTTLAGDVSGASASTVVGKLQGKTLSVAAPSGGQVLTWDPPGEMYAGAWIAKTPEVLNGIAVADLAALAVYADANLQSGATIWVTTLKDYFLLDRASVKGADGITTINSATSGKWLRVERPHTDWQAQTSWYIDAVSGSDEGLGTNGSPLKTHAELVRRVGHGYVPTSNITINIVSASIDAIDVPYRPKDKYVHYKGLRTTVITGMISTSVARDSSINQPQQVTADAGGNFWSSYLDSLVELTSGAASGKSFWVRLNMGNGQAQVSPIVATTIAGFFPTTSSESTSIGNSTFKVVSLTTVPGLTAHTDNTVSMVAGPCGYVFEDLEFSADVDVSGTVAFLTCKMVGFLNTHAQDALADMTDEINLGVHLVSCCVGGPLNLDGPVKIEAGLSGIIGVYGSLYITTGAFFRYLSVYSGRVLLWDAWSWEWNSYAVNIHPNAVLRITGVLWGTSSQNDSYAVHLHSRGTMVCADYSAQKMTGTSSNPFYDFMFHTSKSCRAFDNSVGTFTATRNLTWANMVLTVANNGFGSNVVDPATGAAAVEQTY